MNPRAFASLASLVLAAGQAAVAQSASTTFPMQKGTSWTYRGTVSWGNNRDSMESKQISWKSEIAGFLQEGRFKVALLIGHPSDLAWYTEETERGCYLLISVDDRDFYLHEIEPPCELPKQNPANLLRNGDLVLRLPLKRGDEFGGDNEDPAGPQGCRYDWCVGEVEETTLPGIRGIPGNKHFTAYRLFFQTNPDHQIATWVPEIGLTHFVYSHHGTVSEVDVGLVEFRAGETACPTCCPTGRERARASSQEQ